MDSVFFWHFIYSLYVRAHACMCMHVWHTCAIVCIWHSGHFMGPFFPQCIILGVKPLLSGLATSSCTYRTVSMAWVRLMIICLFRISVSFVFGLLFSLLCQDWAEWPWISSVSQAGLKPVITLPSASGVLRLQKCDTTPCSIFLFTSESVLIDVLV